MVYKFPDLLLCSIEKHHFYKTQEIKYTFASPSRRNSFVWSAFLSSCTRRPKFLSQENALPLAPSFFDFDQKSSRENRFEVMLIFPLAFEKQT